MKAKDYAIAFMTNRMSAGAVLQGLQKETEDAIRSRGMTRPHMMVPVWREMDDRWIAFCRIVNDAEEAQFNPISKVNLNAYRNVIYKTIPDAKMFWK